MRKGAEIPIDKKDDRRFILFEFSLVMCLVGSGVRITVLLQHIVHDPVEIIAAVLILDRNGIERIRDLQSVISKAALRFQLKRGFLQHGFQLHNIILQPCAGAVMHKKTDQTHFAPELLGTAYVFSGKGKMPFVFAHIRPFGTVWLTFSGVLRFFKICHIVSSHVCAYGV